MTLGNLFEIIMNRGEQPSEHEFENHMLLGIGLKFRPMTWDWTRAVGKIKDRPGKHEFYMFADAVSEASWTTKSIAKRKAGEPVRKEDVHPRTSYLIECTKYPNDGSRLWWKPKRAGYTNDLDKAGRYSGVELKECCLNEGNYNLYIEQEVLEGKVGKIARCVKC